MANTTPTFLASYSNRSVDASRGRRALVLLAKTLLAAGYAVAIVILPPQMLFILALPIVVMLLATLWMLPDRRTFPLAALESVFPVYFVLSIIWPIYIAVSLPGLPWLTPTRMALLVQTALLAYSLATSSDLRQYISRVVRSSTWFWVSFLVWEVMQIVTLPMSRTLVMSAKMFVDNQFALAGILFLGCLLFSRKGWASWVSKTLVILALLTAVDGFIELHLGYPPWAHYIPSFMRVDEGIMSVVLGAQARTADGLYRVHGQFPLSLVMAEYLALVIPFVVHSIVTSPGIVRRTLLVLALIFIMAAILITQSRLGLVGAMVTFAAYPLMWAYRIWRGGNSGMLGPALLFGAPAAVVLLLGIVLSSHSLTTRILGGGAQSASNEGRRIQREMAVPRVLHNPIGYGLGNAGNVLGFTNPGGYMTIDSGVLTIVLDLGITGLVAFFGLLFAAINQGVGVFLRTTDRELALAGPAAISILVFIVVRLVLSEENSFSLAFLLLGMILGLAARERAGRGEPATGHLAADPPQDTPIPVAASVSVARIAG
ncbi:O-antigen ligase family protein [Glacieibacterium megasporae]|uniref:O-antigen ligase family protein n=1 Tax=Glacieibacterium megasporae TaxID=2835787 RepID=UPI001C1E3FDF|nr:O-antigen ligase family protein [Polymorphobacter megasporae]UAJ11545.1 O-antigen ligase family protein [Polymorphobacter megasporae]